MSTIKPFEGVGNFTTFPNSVIDYIMPECAPNTWKVVCATIRKTIGWGKKEDWISVSQYMKLTGIASRETCTKAIKDAVNSGYLTQVPFGQSYKYAINREYEFGTSTETVLGTSTETVTVASTETVHTKENITKETNTKDIKRVEATRPKPTKSPKPYNWLDKDQYKRNLEAPELQTYRAVTGRIPGIAQFEIIHRVISEHGFTEDDLKPFWEIWVTRGYKPGNLSWLTEWAVSGQIPTFGRSAAYNNPSVSERNAAVFERLMQEA